MILRTDRTTVRKPKPGPIRTELDHLAAGEVEFVILRRGADAYLQITRADGAYLVEAFEPGPDRPLTAEVATDDIADLELAIQTYGDPESETDWREVLDWSRAEPARLTGSIGCLVLLAPLVTAFLTWGLA